VKDEHRHPAGLLQPHAIPESKWEVISMDFIVGFPLTVRRHDSIFMVVDTLTKSAHFIPVCTMYQVPDIARFFISEIVRLHGVPKRIISDQDRCLQDDFGLVSKRPWEPNLTLVQISPRDRRADRKKEPNLGGYVAYVHDGPTKVLGRVLAIGRVCIQQQLSKHH
jgi:hypothetical protein